MIGERSVLLLEPEAHLATGRRLLLAPVFTGGGASVATRQLMDGRTSCSASLSDLGRDGRRSVVLMEGSAAEPLAIEVIMAGPSSA